MSLSTHKLLTVLLWIFNVVYGLFGLISMVCGASAVALLNVSAMNVVKEWIKNYLVFGDEPLVGSAGLLTSVGIFILMASILGCVVLVKYSRCASITYVCLIFLFIVLQFASAITAITLKQQVFDNVNAQLFKLENEVGKSDPADAMFKDIQEKWSCCGVNSYKEWWLNVTWFREKYKTFADTKSRYIGFTGCCEPEHSEPCSTTAGVETPDCCSVDKHLYMNPSCGSIISRYLFHSFSIVAGASMTFALLEIFGLIIACLFIRSSNAGTSGDREFLTS